MDTQLQLLIDHVARFNQGVDSGDFAPMLEHFAPVAVLEFVGVPVGPFVGRDAITAAYAAQPPDDTITIANQRLVGNEAVCDYMWSRQQQRAGEMRLTAASNRINHLTVTFDIPE